MPKPIEMQNSDNHLIIKYNDSICHSDGTRFDQRSSPSLTYKIQASGTAEEAPKGPTTNKRLCSAFIADAQDRTTIYDEIFFK
ncbi:hypothetical protein GEV33_003411 [Tenebrio molitor]|uniref:Uncharacterized protein n=1 Tax=Tenebrio molitor TaxID=7067 RepID=A0A8J6LFC5_TENMO|nr:hypothetical protein GEV33_003411 [Tenebrio molitor]